jgi:plasmid stabilization system protein ParE
MSHKVLLTSEAKQDIEAAYLYIRADAPETARRWRLRLLELIKTLASFPERHEIAAEARDAGIELRQMLFGNCRILYTVQPDAVHVHALRHGARRPLCRDELPETEQ